MNIKASKAIYFTIILDFTNSINISYHRIKTAESYQTIGDPVTIIYLDAEKTSNEHI